MRTIKFRGKASRKDKDIWLYGDLIKIGDSYHIIGKDDMREDGHHITQDSDVPTWVNEETIGQFTGLFDKNNKEIYEGDIVKDSEGRISYVKWLAQRCGFVLVYNRFDIILTGYGKIDYIEVIGNIYDNSELMKGE